MKNTGVNLLTNPVNSSEERALKFTLSSVADDDSVHIVVTDDDSVHIVMMKVYSPPA